MTSQKLLMFCLQFRSNAFPLVRALEETPAFQVSPNRRFSASSALLSVLPVTGSSAPLYLSGCMRYGALLRVLNLLDQRVCQQQIHRTVATPNIVPLARVCWLLGLKGLLAGDVGPVHCLQRYDTRCCHGVKSNLLWCPADG